MAIPNIDLARYTYELPDDRIAKYPLPERDKSKLLVYNKQITESTFCNIGQYLPKGSMLVFNNTKVIRARLKFYKETGALIEIFCLEPLVPCEVEQAFVERHSTTWKCIVGNSKKWKDGSLHKDIDTPNGPCRLTATRETKEGNTSHITFTWDNSSATFAEIIELAGVTPIPPYLNRETEDIDTTRYQTVYSEHKGSVAAPTAGLHFTQSILDTLRANGHELVNLTLHVGAGTFKPVQTTDISSHVMHTEHIVVERSAIEALRRHGGAITAVGTTSVRTLESIFWLGVRLLRGMDIAGGVSQWDPYTIAADDITTDMALDAILSHLNSIDADELHSMTQIMIVPGYKFRFVNALITNFHQPHSTLLLLIGAFVGEEWTSIYNYALGNGFRFLSYGDSSLLYAKEQ